MQKCESRTKRVMSAIIAGMMALQVVAPTISYADDTVASTASSEDNSDTQIDPGVPVKLIQHPAIRLLSRIAAKVLKKQPIPSKQAKFKMIPYQTVRRTKQTHKKRQYRIQFSRTIPARKQQKVSPFEP